MKAPAKPAMAATQVSEIGRFEEILQAWDNATPEKREEALAFLRENVASTRLTADLEKGGGSV